MGVLPEKGWSVESIELSVAAEPKTVNVGDEITFEIKVKHLPGVRVFLPGTEATLSPFEVKRYRPLPRSEEGGFVLEGGSYRLTIFELGSYVIPSVTIPYVNYEEGALPPPSFRQETVQGEERAPRRFVKTQPIPIVVRSLLQETQEAKETPSRSVREATLPPGVVRMAKRAMASLAGIGLLCLAVYGVFYFWPKTVLYRPPVPPHRIAEKALKEIERERHELAPRDLYLQLSQVSREYLAGRFKGLSLSLPTAELLSRMKGEKALNALLPQLSLLFEEMDLVKFAGHPASKEEGGRFLQVVRQLVTETAPREKEGA